jgi:hypothetical protein
MAQWAKHRWCSRSEKHAPCFEKVLRSRLAQGVRSMQAMVRELASALRLEGLLLLEHFALIQAAPFVIATMPVNWKLPEGSGERSAVESLAGRKPPFGLLL